MPAAKNDIAKGMVFGRLTVLKEASRDIRGNKRWSVRCKCGNRKIVYGSGLRTGTTTSCGCYAKEIAAKMGAINGRKSSATHKSTLGKRRTRLYISWVNMKSRCLNSNNTAYHNYGGRGITVCQKWIDSYEVYRDWAKENGYKKNLVLDRKHNNKGYYPKNCRWVTRIVSANNTRITNPFNKRID